MGIEERMEIDGQFFIEQLRHRFIRICKAFGAQEDIILDSE